MHIEFLARSTILKRRMTIFLVDETARSIVKLGKQDAWASRVIVSDLTCLGAIILRNDVSQILRVLMRLLLRHGGDMLC